jgi:hypothetical protein
MMIRRLLIFAGIFLFSCQNNDPKPESKCTIPAVVVSLEGVDGCSGFAFELLDQEKTRLIPVHIFRCATPPLPLNELRDATMDFEFKAGKTVLLEYQLFDSTNVDVCMAGQRALITCLSEIHPVLFD